MQATNTTNQDQGADGGLQQTQTQPQIGPQPLVTDMTNNQVARPIEGGQDSNMMHSSVSSGPLKVNLDRSNRSIEPLEEEKIHPGVTPGQSFGWCSGPTNSMEGAMSFDGITGSNVSTLTHLNLIIVHEENSQRSSVSIDGHAVILGHGTSNQKAESQLS
jgi:hypothetical protein